MKARPHSSQPGSLWQQLDIVLLYLANPWQLADRARRWDAARRVVLQHARRAG